jgi:hypothetical protein
MLVRKAIRVRLMPDAAQAELMERIAGWCRAISNIALDQRRWFARPGRSISYERQAGEIAELKAGFPWFAEAPYHCLHRSPTHLLERERRSGQEYCRLYAIAESNVGKDTSRVLHCNGATIMNVKVLVIILCTVAIAVPASWFDASTVSDFAIALVKNLFVSFVVLTALSSAIGRAADEMETAEVEVKPKKIGARSADMSETNFPTNAAAELLNAAAEGGVTVQGQSVAATPASPMKTPAHGGVLKVRVAKYLHHRVLDIRA